MFKIGQLVTVDTCGGRHENKITGIKVDPITNKITYMTKGQSITETTEKFINVQGKQTCQRDCVFNKSCKIFQETK